ncbi:hypothetical protein CLV91_1523 [Maribacter vaceletii]|uniref:HPt domain-containing protein n=1 Tax=Maribacter vaceletii TaxID=1206816 RepID=A0A495E7P2_9FLAO|nr:Hpt domain-containing protein [Maribacter vaceletii]RKR12816.1 hypothetical protein CLV91_1523 [Maribacter vaceletii]
MKETPNLSYITKLSNGNKVFEKNLLAIIKKELPLEIGAYESFVNEGDFEETAEYVHKINHKFKILGLDKGHKIAEAYRLNLLEKNFLLKLDFEKILAILLLYIKTV